MSKNKKSLNKVYGVFQVSGKKGVSLIISYILLIVLSLSLAIFVFNWLKGFVPSMNEVKCPDGVSLIISETNYVDSEMLNVTVQNRGRFSIDGFYIRGNNQSEPNFGIYVLDRKGVAVDVNSKNSTLVNTSLYFEGEKNFTLEGDLDLIEVQPFVIDGRLILCESVSKVDPR
ncbi:hypothetical protein H8D36_07130 [archaeon]|nr:hypothetical protein [archaeon]